MLSRRTMFAVLSVGLVAAGASILMSQADDRVLQADDRGTAILVQDEVDIIRPEVKEVPLRLNEQDATLGSLDLINDVTVESSRQRAERTFIELQRKIAANLSDDELKARVLAAEKEVKEATASSALQKANAEYRNHLIQIQEHFPDSEAAKSAQRALEELERKSSEKTRLNIRSEIPKYGDFTPAQ